MIKVGIIEDEVQAINILKHMLHQLDEEVVVVFEAGRIELAKEKLEQHQIDLLFLDIMLQGGTGFDLLETIGEKDFQLIFTTAFEQFAIKAFKYAAVDYLLKPFDVEELQQAITHANRVKKDQLAFTRQLLHSKSLPAQVQLHTQREIHTINLRDIIYCQSFNNYTEFHLEEGQRILTSKTLKFYADLFDDQLFFRCHRSFLVNLDKIKKVHFKNGIIYLTNDQELELAKRSKTLLKKSLLERVKA